MHLGTPPRKAPQLQGSAGRIAPLKVTLQNVRPPIWRRLEVPVTLSFGSLHDILQIAFGSGGVGARLVVKGVNSRGASRDTLGVPRPARLLARRSE